MKKLYNLKRLLKKRNNGGFTLVEVIIASVLLGILVTGLVMFITPILSVIQNNKNAARATMLAESINTYISGNIRNAAVVEVVKNTTLETLKTTGLQGTEALTRIVDDYMLKSKHDETHEVRCIGITWLEDSSSPVGKKKQMLTYYTVDNNFADGYTNSLKIISDTENRVFDDVLYDNLYPRITLDTFKKLEDDEETEKDTNANGYKITSNIYLDMGCYSVESATARENSTLAFEGVAYVECTNMTTTEEVDGVQRLVPGTTSDTIEINDEQSAIDAGRATNQYLENGKNYYYPDTYIFYVVAK